MTCAKARVTCTIINPQAGLIFTGENWCANPQPACPRAPGEDYTKCKTVCGQSGHAELDALRKAGEHARGGFAVLRGHTYMCQGCQEALFGAGVLWLGRSGPAAAPAVVEL